MFIRVVDFLSLSLILLWYLHLIIWYVRPFNKCLFGSRFRFLYFRFINFLFECESQRQVNALNKGVIYLSEEKLLLNEPLDTIFIRGRQMKLNLILRDKIKWSNCKDYDKIKLSKFDLWWIEFVSISNSNPYHLTRQQ